MSESLQITTSNGYEIKHPTDVLTDAELKNMVNEYGIHGENPSQRLDSFKQMPTENIAVFMSDLNKRLQGSEETLIVNTTMKVGDKQTVAPEDRYDLFTHLNDKIKQASDINPARVGDALSLGTVILHPFADGNGRTARVLGLIFRDDYDAPDFADTFNILAESRDAVRQRDGFLVNGYIPYMEDGNRNDTNSVSAYFDRLMTSDVDNLYTSPYGQAPLHIAAPVGPA